MKPIRAGIFPASIVSLVVLMASGCAPQLRAIPGPSQAPIENGRGVFEYRDALNVSAVAVGQPPLGTGGEFVAFGIQVQNSSQGAFVVDVSRIVLGLGSGAQWIDQGPMPPDNLVRAYQSARASADGVAEVTGPELVMWRGRGPHVYRYHYYRDYAYYGYPYWGYYGYPYYYYDTGRDIYYQQQATAAFLARLLRSQEVPPGYVVGGFVVFSHTLHKGDEFRLLVPLYPVASASQPSVATRPATAPAGAPEVFEFHFVAK
jgi:hypothetical protein